MRRETGFRDGFIDREMMMMVCSHIILIVSKVLGKKGRRMKRWDVLSKKKEIRATYRENKVTPYQ